MINKQIIFAEEQNLAEQGKIKYTGRVVVMQGLISGMDENCR